MTNEVNMKALESFLMDTDILDGVYTRLAGFNAFETLGLVNAEIRHSNLLAWLLSPKENHGLGDAVLKKLIQSLFYENRDFLRDSSLSLIDVSLMDYNDFVVRREWKNIDVVCISEANKFVFVIENKIWSKESDHQLKQYYAVINNEYPSYSKLFAFLTPSGDTASDSQTWLTLEYSRILKILETAIELKQANISQSVSLFLEQYVSMLRRYIVGDNELEKICRDIYYKHQKALDLIFEYKPDIYLEVSSAINDLLVSSARVVIDSATKAYVRFTTEALEKAIPKSGDGWTASKRLLLYEFQIRNEKVVLKLIIGPGDSTFREKLYDIAKSHQPVFSGMLNSLTAQYTQIYAKDIMPKGFIDKYESIEDIKAELRNRMAKLLEAELPKIDEIIVRSLA